VTANKEGMTMAIDAKIENPKTDLEKQKAYAESLAAKGFDYGFAVGTAFVESMRNTHYKHTGTALDELIDNSIEAGATQVCIALGYGGGSTAKPDALAVIDDGHGMPKGMLRPAAAWGGTHRHNEDTRTGFGRFGFGLPSASVNQARRFSIYAITEGDAVWRSVTVDLDDIAKGNYTDDTGKVHVPEEVEGTEPPKWVLDHIAKHMPGGKLSHGTVVMWEKMDRIKWNTTKGMRDNLLQHFGVMFRNYLHKTGIKFDGTSVEPLDPLFITPGYRYFDEDEDRAKPLDPAEIEVKSKRNPDKKVKVTVRYALFPHRFFSKDKARDALGNSNSRFKVANDHRGIIVCRMGRQIDVVEHTPWRGLEKFRNDDRYWALEVDFPAELDEEFTIANSKQGVVMSDRIWDLLQDAGVERAIRALRKEITSMQKADAAKPEDPERARPSEASMKESEKFRRERAGGSSAEREAKAREQFEQYVKQKAKEQRRPEAAIRAEAQEEEAKHPYRVEFAGHPGAPFYRVVQRGGMKVLEINTAHRFYSDIYASSASNKFLRAGLEVLLFSMGEAELDAQGNQDKSAFYHVEKTAWSERLEVALDALSRFGHDMDTIDTSGDETDSEAA
jgi:hypothetical protein